MSSIAAVYTIGVYGFTEDKFLRALTTAQVDVLIDVRQRRGVRGSRYAFANATRLESALTSAAIACQSWKDVAPSSALRDTQRQADLKRNVAKSTRTRLSPQFVSGYTDEVLNVVTPQDLASRLGPYRRPAFLCVEQSPAACHRSLLAGWLAHELGGVAVVDLEP